MPRRPVLYALPAAGGDAVQAIRRAYILEIIPAGFIARSVSSRSTVLTALSVSKGRNDRNF